MVTASCADRGPQVVVSSEKRDPTHCSKLIVYVALSVPDLQGLPQDIHRLRASRVTFFLTFGWKVHPHQGMSEALAWLD